MMKMGKELFFWPLANVFFVIVDPHINLFNIYRKPEKCPRNCKTSAKKSPNKKRCGSYENSKCSFLASSFFNIFSISFKAHMANIIASINSMK